VSNVPGSEKYRYVPYAVRFFGGGSGFFIPMDFGVVNAIHKGPPQTYMKYAVPRCLLCLSRDY
jgi:hypothetical protein